MSNSGEQRVRPEVVLEAFVSQQARIAGDVIEVGPHTWAIHGVIPVDGDVIIGEFESPQEAHAVLEQLGGYPSPNAGSGLGDDDG